LAALARLEPHFDKALCAVARITLTSGGARHIDSFAIQLIATYAYCTRAIAI
jgi:hypothetical protein